MTLKHFDANSLEGGAEADKGYDRHNFSAKISKYLLADAGFITAGLLRAYENPLVSLNKALSNPYF